MNAHGKISYSWEGELFIISIGGEFNKEGVEYYAPLLQTSVLNRNVNDWKRLEIWDEDALGSPDTIVAVKEIYDWFDKNGCTLIAIVTCNSLQDFVIKDSLKSQCKIFSEKSKAQKWLETANKYE